MQQSDPRSSSAAVDLAKPQKTEADSAEFARLIRLIFYRRWLIAACMVLFGLFGAVQLRNSRPVYSATAIMKYEPRGATVVDMGGGSAVYQTDEIRTAVEMVRGPEVAWGVVKRLKMDSPSAPAPPSDPSPLARARNYFNNSMDSLRDQIIPPQKLDVGDPEVLRREALTRSMQGRIGVRQKFETKLIEVSASDSNPARAANIANAFCEEFIASMSDNRTQAYGYARDYLTNQIDTQKEKLAKAEKELYEFAGNNNGNLRTLDGAYEIATQITNSLTDEIEKEKNEIAVLKSAAEAADKEDVAAYLIRENPVYSALNDRMGTLLIEEATLKSENTDRLPALVKVRREMAALRDQMTSVTLAARSDAGARLALSTMKLHSLEERLRGQQLDMKEIEKSMIPYRVLQREVDSTREIFTSLLDQYKRLEVTDDVKPSNVTVVSRATTPTIPISPKITRTLTSSLVIGALVGIALTLLLNFLDRSVKDPKIIEARLGLPTLGMVPALSAKKGRLLRRAESKLPILLREKALAQETEAFRYLRTSVQYAAVDREPQILLVTSCFPQEGKSTVAANIATSFAERGLNTLLIDADLKIPTVHKTFSLPRTPGLSEVLTRQTPLAEAISHAPEAHLDVLPAGASTPAPLNLLESNAMRELLKDLRGKYQTIIIDSPPCHGMADSLVLASRVDGVCLVVKQGETLTEILERTVEKLRSIGAPLLGAVYNSGKSAEAKAYGYSYQYTYKYEKKGRDSGEMASAGVKK